MNRTFGLVAAVLFTLVATGCSALAQGNGYTIREAQQRGFVSYTAGTGNTTIFRSNRVERMTPQESCALVTEASRYSESVDHWDNYRPAAGGCREEDYEPYPAGPYVASTVEHQAGSDGCWYCSWFDVDE